MKSFFTDLADFGKKVALIENDTELTYLEMQNEIDVIKEKFSGRGLAFCVCTNSIASVEGYVSFLQSNIPVVLINYHTDREQFEEMVRLYSPSYLWVPEGYLSEDISFSHRNYTLVKHQGMIYPMHEELAVMLTTSGSTGSPKLVRQSYKNINANTASIVEYLNITGEDRAITTLPMHYTFGLSVIQTHLMQGATIVLTEATIVQPEFWKLIDKHQVTTFAGVPYTYEMLKKIRFLRMKVASLRYLIQAGGKLGKELHYEMATSCAEKGIKFIVMYGQTEATARMSYVPADHAIDKAGSIGIAIPGGKFWVEDAEGNKITETGTAGELVYQGENVTMGYAQCKEDLERGYDQGDILHTGDMACFDDDGYYYIVGRKKRFLKLFGNRVNMDEVEGLLKKIGLECAVCGEDDHMKICVVGQDNKEIAEKYIDEHTSVPRFGYTVHVIEEIPRNDSGKVQYSELENMI